MAVNMAPVYYVTGNHEASRSQYDELKKILFTVPLHPICYAEIAGLCRCSKAAIQDSIEAVRKKIKKFF